MYKLKITVIIFCLVIRTAYLQCQLAQVCVHDQSSDDCWGSQVLIPGLSVFGCCPGCGIPQTTTPSDENNPPVLDDGCQPPFTCLDDGKFGPVQCKGDRFTGRCFCTNEDGERIFGQMWRNEATDMTCACSRRRAELESTSNRTVTLHCTSTGDYEQLQCDDGICWCADPKTGQPTVIPMPEENMTRLPCYNELEVGSQYLRQCESLVQARDKISQEQSAHGTNFFGNPVTFCDYDGSYGPYQIQNNIAFCSGRDGKALGSWQVQSQDIADMNCNCARDTAVYFPERGMTVTETCTSNGNYRPDQNIGGVYYCVDSDGYPVTDFMDEWPTGMNCNNFT